MTASMSVVAVGAGRMGRGIALAHALRGFPVVLLDLKPRDEADRARVEVEANHELRCELDRLMELGAVAADSVDYHATLITVARADAAPDILAGADIVFEAVPENVDAKRAALAQITQHVRPDALIGSTTSAMLATELAAMVEHPERLLNVHWLNPAFVVPLVELSVHPRTSPDAVTRLREHLESIGKVPVVCGATPGYIVPRLQALIMNEAARMVDEGVATAVDIDTATRFGLGFRFANLGVLEFIDYGGNDTLYQAGHYFAEHIDPHRYAVPEIVARYWKSGRNGLRDGRGFHEYPVEQQEDYRKDVLGRLLGMLRHMGLGPGSDRAGAGGCPPPC